MGKYKISDLESLSGVKAHTIRIWEQRYNILTPLRTNSNIRYYDDEQLRKLLNVVSLMNAGNKISTISKLSDKELNERIGQLLNVGGIGIKEEMLINQMISAGLAYDESLFEKAFSNSILSYGIMTAYQRVFYPMLIKVGLLWSTTELQPSQEHFISNLIKQKMFAAIDSLNPPSNKKKEWILFLPEGEQHDLGLLIANYGLRSKGFKVFYLGANVPLDNLYQIAKQVNPTHYLTFAVRSNQQSLINEFLNKISQDFDSPHVYVCCEPDLKKDLKLETNQHVLSTYTAFQEMIESI